MGRDIPGRAPTFPLRRLCRKTDIGEQVVVEPAELPPFCPQGGHCKQAGKARGSRDGWAGPGEDKAAEHGCLHFQG
jgi:hypothetical protein